MLSDIDSKVEDFLEVSIDPNSLDYSSDLDHIFTSAPVPVPVSELSIEPPEVQPEISHGDNHFGFEQDNESLTPSDPEVIYTSPPRSDTQALEPQSRERVEQNEVYDDLKEAEASPLELPNEAMVASLSQLIKLEAEGATPDPTMTPIPQFSTMTTDERRQLHELFKRYIKLKKVYNEPIDNLTFADFQNEVDLARETATMVHGWEAVRFTVKVNQGKVVLRAKKAQVK